jgi:hypothetical protein
MFELAACFADALEQPAGHRPLFAHGEYLVLDGGTAAVDDQHEGLGIGRHGQRASSTTTLRGRTS